MPQRNEPHNHPSHRPTSRTPHSSSRATSSRVPASQRVNVPNARDELERERELYSAHDPNQSALSPAQRYAQSQQNKANSSRQNYWSRHPEDAGRANRMPATREAGRAYDRAPVTSEAGSTYDRTHVSGGSGARAAYSGAHPSHTSRTPRVGEATLSGRIPRQAAPAPSASGTIPRQTPYASGTMPRQAAASPAASGAMPQQTAPYASGAMPRQASQEGAQQNPSTRPARRGATQRQGTRPSATRRSGYSEAPGTASGSGGGSRTNSSRVPESSDFSAERYLSAQRPRRKVPGSIRNKLIGGAVAIVVVAIGVFAFTTWDANRPVNVTLNGQQQSIEGQQRTIEGLLDTNTVSVTPGNYVAVDGSVMREGEGTRATASINGQATDDFSTRLNDGDDISLTNGTDITEDFTEGDHTTIEPTLEMKGTGAVHLYTQKGEAGEKVVRTGNESGKTAEVTTKEPVNGVVQYYNVNTNGDKVIALTFDDGPWDSSTEAILDTLKENDAKATFYTIGDQISKHKDLVKRAADEGHEIGTHTWDHAEGSGQGVSLILMSSDERKQEVEKGMKAIKDATGQDASLMFRSPGGNFDESVAKDLSSLINAEIGWNVDTGDWQKPGTDTIAQRIESASPGEIILMHDGGGDRSETVAALKQALPKLKEQGYRFVTVSELINSYPYQEQ